MKRELLDGEKVFIIHEFLPHEECNRLIVTSETIGYEAFTIDGEVIASFRNNARLMHDDPELAESLWQRASEFVPPMFDRKAASGFNPRFRFYRYKSEESFVAHYDGHIQLEDCESRLTFMVYLSDVLKGGETRFYNSDGAMEFEVRPQCGTALVFEHDILHEGVAVATGCKYVLRTAVMYG